MTIELYDLAGADPAVRFSPFCWRTRMALAHKGLAVECRPWSFTEKSKIAFSDQGRVPVLRDGGHVVSDSWAIARDLETRYPDRPSLFGGAGGEAHAHFVNSWADTVLQPGIARLIIADVWSCLAEHDKAYFRTSREDRFGAKLETIQSTRDADAIAFRRSLQPLRTTLATQAYLGGPTASYADYIVFGGFQCTRATSGFELLEASDAVALWRERMLDLFDGLARTAPRAVR